MTVLFTIFLIRSAAETARKELFLVEENKSPLRHTVQQDPFYGEQKGSIRLIMCVIPGLRSCDHLVSFIFLK
jgi:hypothetical protein